MQALTVLFGVSFAGTEVRGQETNIPMAVAFNRIIHGWTNYSTAFNTSHDLGPGGDYATIATFYTPTQDVCLLEYGAIVIWSGAGGQRFNFSNFTFGVHLWSSLEAFTNNPVQGDVATYFFVTPTGGNMTVPDAITRGGRPAYEIRFSLTNAPITLTNGGTWLIGLSARTFTKDFGELFVPTSSSPGVSDLQAGSLIVGGWRSLVDAGGLTIYDGQLATELFVRPIAPPRFDQGTQMRSDGLHLLLTVEPGLPLVIQRSDNLRLWDDWYTIVPNTNRLEVVDPSALASASQFYRIQIR